MKDLRNAPFVLELADMADNMYRLGWNERNGGNISLLLGEEELRPYLEGNDPVLRELPLAVPFSDFAGKYFLKKTELSDWFLIQVGSTSY